MRKSLRTPFNQCCMTPNRRPWVEALVALLTIPNVSGLTSWNVRKRQVQKHAPDQASKRAKRGWRNLNRLQNHLTQVKPFSNYKIQMETWKRQRELCTVSQTMQPAFYGHWSFHIGPCGVAADRLLFCCSCWWDDFAAVPASTRAHVSNAGLWTRTDQSISWLQVRPRGVHWRICIRLSAFINPHRPTNRLTDRQTDKPSACLPTRPSTVQDAKCPKPGILSK